MHKVVVIGGGAGGLELVTQLGNRYGRRRRERSVSVTLVDPGAFHVWKPLLHEVAAGSMDPSIHQVDYAAQGYWHGFDFAQGAMIGLDRRSKLVKVDRVVDEEGNQIFPPRALSYDTLVIAIGSTTNFFGVDGAEQHSFALDSVPDAERFRRGLIAACYRADARASAEGRCVRIVIVGGGATGVELAAELRQTAQALSVYGLHRLDPMKDIDITIIEASPRILPSLPERVSESAAELLARFRVNILLSEQVRNVAADGLHTANGTFVRSDLVVWAAGIRALPVLTNLDELEVDERGRLVVHPTLQTSVDPSIFALGDCAHCAWLGHATSVPPRAQAAHQQASFLNRLIGLRLRGGDKELPQFHYHDFGSLVSFGRLGATGNLMGGLIGGRIFVDGTLAKIMYISLYRMHTIALYGWWRTIVDILANSLRRTISTRVKLH